MEQRLSLITLGVSDLQKARHFYETLGWKASDKSTDGVVFFQLNGFALALFPWTMLAADAQISQEGSGFRGFSLAYNVADKPSVHKILLEAQRAGGKIVKAAEDVFWGGHSGYFTDLDGHLWEVACNPFSKLEDNGNFLI